jgi:lysophospholipase L1-like esterase
MNILEQNNAGDFFRGLDHIHVDGKYSYLHRLDAKLIKYYESLGETKAIRAKCSAGVSCCFKSNSKSLSISFISLTGARKYFSFDLFINGYFVRSIEGNKSDQLQNIKIDFEFDNFIDQDNEIEIYFPQSRTIGIAELSIENAIPLPKPKHSYLALGDSITQGMDAVKPSSTYAVQLSRLTGYELFNQGVGGHIFDDRTVFSPIKKPEIITIAFGTNDFSTIKIKNTLTENIDNYLKKITELFPQTPTYVMTPIWRSIEGELNDFSANLQDIRKTIQELAISHNLDVIDGLKLVPNQESFFVDGCHPTDEGFLHYALGIAKYLKPS